MRIFEPNRAVYSGRKKKKGFCDFCDPDTLKDQEIERLQTQYWRVLACKYPYMDGNVMLIPKRHVTELEKLTRDEWRDFSVALIGAKKILGDAFHTKSFNFTLQIGPYSGGTIKHLHWMIVPRPRKQNLSAWNVMHDFYFVTMGYKDLKQKLEKLLTESASQKKKK